jgi:hypothetical protein
MRASLFATVLAGWCLVCATTPAIAVPTTIDFEDLSDFSSVSDHYPGLSFSNAVVLTAGVSLNEFDFPPRSGTNVVFDSGGAISIIFSTPVTSVSGYFTYSAQLTLTAFDASNNLLDSATSAFASNFTGSGNSPNELISLNSIGGIASVVFAGSQFGGSFTLDDLTFELAPLQIPEPPPAYVLIAVFAGLWLCALRKSSHRAV